MDKNALINILNSLLDREPAVRQDIMNYIPAPTILSAMNVLVDLEKKFVNSFPFNKNGPGKDDYTFSRVRDYLADLIVSSSSSNIIHSPCTYSKLTLPL
jgi:hypothetical protein